MKKRTWKRIVLATISVLTMLGTSIGVTAAESKETEEGQVYGGTDVPDTAFEVVEDMGIGWNLGIISTHSTTVFQERRSGAILRLHA